MSAPPAHARAPKEVEPMDVDEDSRREHPGEIRFVTYLSPSIPRELFEAIIEHVRRTLGCERASLRVEARVSGPERGSTDPFSGDEADVGFMCLPSFVWLRELRPPPVELLGVAPVFEDAGLRGGPSTSAMSWSVGMPRSGRSPSSAAARGRTTTCAR